MRLVITFCMLLASQLHSQTIMGKWTGRIESSVRLNVTIDSNLRVEVPSANNLEARIREYNLESSMLSASLSLDGRTDADLKVDYNGSTGTLDGIWTQERIERTITLTKVDSFVAPKRVQTPEPPYPYEVSNLSVYQGLEDFWLSGTLTAPYNDLDSMVVILISGSGMQNRNSELLGHQPFLVLSDFLTRQGISVFRYDERGVGESSGAFFNATSEDFLNDVLACVDKLDSLGYKKIGLIGHSEGGLIANMACALDDRLVVMVSLAGVGLPADQLLSIQNRNILIEQGVAEQEVAEYVIFIEEAYDLIDIESPKDSLYDPLKELCFDFYESRDSTYQKMYGPSSMGFYMGIAGGYLTPWLRYFINHDPGDYITQISCPVLVLNGTMDIQVSAKENLASYEKHLLASQAPFFDVIQLDSINHLFQKVENWDTNEYYESTETFNESVMELISDWLKTSMF